MAYVNQEFKAQVTPKIKTLLKAYGLQGSLSIRNHSTLVLTVRSGRIDFFSNYQDCSPGSPRRDHIQVNPYWLSNHWSGAALDFLKSAVAQLKGDRYFDHTDISTDHFDCSHYVAVDIGRWNRPYTVT